MSLVSELQNDITASKISTQDILRKAYLISIKLNIDNISEWLNFEMNGYNNWKELPEYRVLQGTIQKWNPLCGWEPIIFPDKDSKRIYSSIFVLDSINQLESIINITDGDMINYGGEKFDILTEEFNTKIRNRISKAYLENILGVIKNKILKWTLDLEKNGISGENMSFTEKEKQNASNIIYNFNGDNARINNNSTDNSTNIVYSNPEIIKQLNALKDEVNKLDSNSEESLEIIENIEEQLKSKQPNKTIIKSLLGALPQIANIVSIGTAILSFIPKG